MAIPLDEFRLEHFEPRIGERFRFLRPDAAPGETDPAVELILLEAQPLPHADRYPGRPPFSLVFELPAGPELSVHPHRFQTEGFAECDLLVARIAVPQRMRENPQGMFYEAVFA